MLFGDVVATSAAVTATSARSAKTAALADLLGRLAPDEVRPAVGFLTGLPRQGRIGVGWATLGGVDVTAADEPSVEIAEVDAVIDDLAVATGPGSVGQKRDLLTALYGRMTEDERWFFVRLLGGELRQGALVGVMVDAVAKAAGVPATAVRRAHMLGGRLDDTAVVALAGGAEALAAIGLQVGRAVQPMLASTAPDVATAVEALGTSSVEWKLDGLRIQVHRSGDRVAVFTRNLNVITDRVPEIVRVAAELPVDRVVLDGEAIAMAERRPTPPVPGDRGVAGPAGRERGSRGGRRSGPRPDGGWSGRPERGRGRRRPGPGRPRRRPRGPASVLLRLPPPRRPRPRRRTPHRTPPSARRGERPVADPR